MIEVGNIFQLGTKYSQPMGATYLDEQGVERDIVMGSYGIGLARIAAAAVEQHHDEHGIVWPASIAPFQVHLLVVRVVDETQAALAEELYESLQRRRLRGALRRPRALARRQVQGRRPARLPASRSSSASAPPSAWSSSRRARAASVATWPSADLPAAVTAALAAS